MSTSSKKIAIFLTFVFVTLQWCLKTTFNQVSQAISEVDWSPNGQYLAVGSVANRVTVFSSVTSNVLWFETFSNDVTSVKFSKSGKWLGVATTNSETIRLYNIPSFSLNISFAPGHSSSSTTVWQLDFSYDNRKIVTCGSDGNVIQTNIANLNNDYIRTLTTNKNVFSCKYASNGKVGAVSDDGKFYMLRSDSSGTIDRQANKNYCKDLDFRAKTDRQYYCGCSCDSNVYQFDTQNGNMRDFFVTTSNIWAVSQSPDNTYLAVGGKDGHFYILDTIDRLNPLVEAYFKQPVDINSIRVSDDNNKVAVSRIDGVINIYVRTCSFCPVGYYLNVTCRICTYDIVGCSSCKNSTLCYTCYSGYYLDATTTLCVLCQNTIKGCLLCSSNTTCIGCTSMFYLSSGACYSCGSLTPLCQQCYNNGTCYKCGYASYLTTTNSCALCNSSILNCRACYLKYNTSSTTNSTLHCIQCVPGFYASMNQCLPCSSNCIFCTATTCIACNQQYKLIGTSCVKCDANCEACTEAGTCLDCVPTTFLTTTGTCSVCTYPCLTCSVLATNCTSCTLGFYKTGTSCTRCAGCPVCNPVTGVCSSCPIGQYIRPVVNTCGNCLNTTSDCAICSPTACLACEINYYLTPSGTCALSTAISNCMIYQKNSTTVCGHCGFGYYLDLATNNSCIKCPKECATCDSTTLCTQCHVGYYYQSSNFTCMTCVDTCRSCNSSTQCLSCGEEYYLSGTSCLLCSSQIANCTSCLNQTHCLDCSLEYRVAADYLSCTKCSSPCLTCNSSGCLSCQQGYFYLSNTCTRCPNTCVSCSSSSICTGCVVGYALNPSYSCVLCDVLYPNCYSCSYSACSVCKKYYTYNTTSNLCQTCSSFIPNCLNCNNATVCEFCKIGLYVSGDQQSCLKCSDTITNCQKCTNGSACEQCMSGFIVSATNQCQKCVTGCFSCSNTTTCDKCQPGFIKVIGNVCSSCGQQILGCKICDVNGCNNCYVGYYLVSSINCTLCKAAMNGCLVCSSDSVCLSCDKGYFLNSSSKCQSCSVIAACSECNKTTGVCVQCMTGYKLNSSNLCQLCSSIYSQCAACNSSGCIRCETGSYLSSFTCLSCTTLYQSCILCNSSQCLQCQAGYYKHTNGSCQLCSIQGCQLCQQTGLTCLTCDNYHFLQGTSCVLCESMDFGCQHCNGINACLLCKNGYYLHSNGSCLICETRFTACSQCTSSKCLTCKSNYFQNLTASAGDCLDCGAIIPGCSLCIDQNQCLLCKSGYYLQNFTCSSCTLISECLICQNNSTCLFCAEGNYLLNGSCLSCSAAIVGCFSCVSSSMCLVCSGSYTMSDGLCLQVKGAAPKVYAEIKFISQYVNKTHLKHTLYAVYESFIKVQQQWNSATKITLVTPPKNKTQLEIKFVQWNTHNSLSFYTDNPLGDLISKSNEAMPFISKFKRRFLFQLQDLNMKIDFYMTKSAINQILPELDTDNSDLSLQYDTSDPEFYKSIIKNERYYYFLYGASITGILLFLYLIKIIFIVPTTSDTGQIIPHILLVKVCAMVIYPSYGEFINYCYGFTFIDFPWLNELFSKSLTNSADGSIASYKMYYNNMNIASTYLLALIIFISLYGLCTLMMICKKSNKIGAQQIANISEKSYRLTRNNNEGSIFEQFRSLIYNLFIAGLVFNAFSNIIGMFINSVEVISLSGVFYLLGIIIYSIILMDAIQDIVKQKKKFNKIRVCIKASLMAVISWSSIGLFTAMAVLDTAMMIYQYKVKIKEWVVPKVWMLSNSMCLIAYSSLIFLSNSVIGIVIASILIFIVFCLDCYLQYCQHLQYQKIQSLQQKKGQKFERNLSIQAFMPQNHEVNQTGNNFDIKQIKGIQQITLHKRNPNRKRSNMRRDLEFNQKIDSMLVLRQKDPFDQAE